MPVTFNLKDDLSYQWDKKTFQNSTIEETTRYLKGLYTNKERLEERWLKLITNPLCDELKESIRDFYPRVEPYSYKEAFEIKDETFRAKVFGSINITEMMENLGKKRLKVEGIPVKRKQFDKDGNFTGYKEYDNIYETYEISGEKLGVTRRGRGLDGSEPIFVYAVKCWCTSTNKEHWLWINEKYKDQPLDAIASTFMIHENLIPHIKELKRQGDILLVEMGDKDMTPEGSIVSLSKEQYFELLTCES